MLWMDILIAAGLFATLVILSRQSYLRRNQYDDEYEEPEELLDAPTTGCAGVAVLPIPKNVLFLDFDGVLHPGFAETFSRLPLLEELMNRWPQLGIVLSTNWREHHEFDELKKLFPDSLKERVVGTTPLCEDAEHQRHTEIQHFTQEHGVRGWLALDDSADLFPPACDYLALIDRRTGLTPESIEQIEWMIRERLVG